MVSTAAKVCSSAPDRLGDITAAVELKFLVPLVPVRVKVPGFLESPGRPQPRSMPLEEQQLQLQLQTYDAIANTIKTVARQRAVSCFDIQEQNLHERDFWKSHWIVKKANSAEPTGDDPRFQGYIWVPVEVDSPKLAWKDPKMMQRVEAVITALRLRHGIVSNYSCEVHVHLGRTDGRLFSLPTMKRFATLAWLAEPVLRAVKDPKSPNFDHVYTWSSALRERSRLALALSRYDDVRCLHSGPQDEFDLFLARAGRCTEASPQAEALRAIWCAGSHAELGRMLSGAEKKYRRLGFNFSALGEEDERAKTGPKTIEVRFFEGIIREGFVLGWLRICGTLLEIAAGGDAAELQFRHAVRRLLKEGETAPADQAFGLLMEDIGIDGSIAAPFQSLISKYYGSCERLDAAALRD